MGDKKPSSYAYSPVGKDPMFMSKDASPSAPPFFESSTFGDGDYGMETRVRAVGSDDPDDRMTAECRFCQEGEGSSGNVDGPDHLIGPCNCRGSVRWVHRGCLDQWRAVSPKPSSFSSCDLCHAEYQMEYRGDSASGCDRCKVYSWITFDFALLILAINGLAALCSVLVWAIDRDRARDKIFTDWLDVSAPPALFTDWLSGWLLFFFLLGLLGLIFAIGRFCCGCTCTPGPPAPYYGYGDCYFIWCFVPDCHSHHYHHHGSSDCCSCGSCNCSGGDCNMDCKDGGEYLLVVLAVIVIILIITGFIIGIVLAVMVGIRIVKRRMEVLHNKYKAGQWVVMDLVSQHP